MTAVAQRPGIEGIDLGDGPGPAPTIHVALIRVMNEVDFVAKRDVNRTPGASYNFRGIDAVMNALGPAFRKHGVIAVPQVQETTQRDVKTSTGKPAREVTVQVRYVFYGPLGDSVEAVVPGEAMDNGDKGTAKAMSVAYRTALLQVFCLPTDEPEPDSQTYVRGTGSVDVEVAAAARDAERPSRAELLEQVNAAATRVQELRGESDYAALDRLATYCRNRLGVNVIAKQTDEGAVEDINLGLLKDGQLALLLGVMSKSIRELTAAGQEA